MDQPTAEHRTIAPEIPASFQDHDAEITDKNWLKDLTFRETVQLCDEVDR